MKKITIIIPCHNEEVGIAKVIQGLPIEKLSNCNYSHEIIVIDNNSDDNTAGVARTLGATVIEDPRKGKGNAVITGFTAVSADTDFVVMLDGDNTYKLHEMLRLIEPLENDFCDVIVGSRLSGKTKENALKFQNRVANWTYTFLVRQFYRANITDVLSGYFAWKKSAVDSLVPHLKANGFAIEMEMITKSVKLGHTVFSVPITYDQREGITKLNSIRDGVSILHKFFVNLFWKYDTH